MQITQAAALVRDSFRISGGARLLQHLSLWPHAAGRVPPPPSPWLTFDRGQSKFYRATRAPTGLRGCRPPVLRTCRQPTLVRNVESPTTIDITTLSFGQPKICSATMENLGGHRVSWQNRRSKSNAYPRSTL